MTAAQLALPPIAPPTAVELARHAQEKIGSLFARAFRRVARRAESTQMDLLDASRVATAYMRDRTADIAEFERRHGQPRGSLAGAMWADIRDRWTACKSLRLLTILRHALAAVAGPLIRRTHRGRAVVDSLTCDDGQREMADPTGIDPLARLLRDADDALDDADAWLAEHEPQRGRKGTSLRTQERERADERALRKALDRSAARFAASAGRVGRAEVTA